MSGERFADYGTPEDRRVLAIMIARNKASLKAIGKIEEASSWHDIETALSEFRKAEREIRERFKQ